MTTFQTQEGRFDAGAEQRGPVDMCEERLHMHEALSEDYACTLTVKNMELAPMTEIFLAGYTPVFITIL